MSINNIPPKNLWNTKNSSKLSLLKLLVYRSRLLGADLQVTNFGGGNTSTKLYLKDPLTNNKEKIMFVKGSGGDLGTIKLDGFSSLYMRKFFSLKKLYRGKKFEDDMIPMYPHCYYNLNARPTSVDTPLHGFIEYDFVDHTHPDAIIAIATAKDGKKICSKVFNNKVAWVGWQRPGFDLGLKLGEISKNKKYIGVILGGHGLFTWGNNDRECYTRTIKVITQATNWLKRKSKSKPFGKIIYKSFNESKRKEIIYKIIPFIRSEISSVENKISHFNDHKFVLEYVNSYSLKKLADIGTSCPDHFIRTKKKPIVLNFDPSDMGELQIKKKLKYELDKYRKSYFNYHLKNKSLGSPKIRDPNPIIFLIPRVGMISFAKNKTNARLASEFYLNAINVMKGAEGVSNYMGLSDREAFNVEYWSLEEDKLKRLPKPKPLSGKVALITGASGAIGKASARKLLENGTTVFLTDINKKALNKIIIDLKNEFTADNVSGCPIDVTNEASVKKCFNALLDIFGGIDILISSVGINTEASFEETTLSLWNKNFSVLSTGYFLVAKESFKIMKNQSKGGSVIFVVSKNGMIPSNKVSSYCSAKAAEIQLSRCIALEGAKYNIRSNVVNPDAVIKESNLWTDELKSKRSRTYNIKISELENYYKNRSLLKKSVYGKDIAEAIYHFCLETSQKSTGNILNVDAGHVATFTR